MFNQTLFCWKNIFPQVQNDIGILRGCQLHREKNPHQIGRQLSLYGIEKQDGKDIFHKVSLITKVIQPVNFKMNFFSFLNIFRHVTVNGFTMRMRKTTSLRLSLM
jgi:hypothetical protein